MDKWISVEDRLPDNENDVLCVVDSMPGRKMEVGYYNATRWVWQFTDGWRFDVTHWQPLPDPPQSD